MAWNGSGSGASTPIGKKAAKSRKVSSGAPMSGAFKGTLALILVLIIGAGAYWFATNEEVRAKVTEKLPKSNKIAEVEAEIVEPKEEAPKEETTPEIKKRFEGGVEVVKETIITNSNGAVIEKLVLANGKKMSKIHPPKPVFDNPCDQVIALAISTKPGQSMPPLPNLDESLEKEFLDSLLNPFKIEDTDSEEVKELKARVLETKAFLKDEIKNGGSVLEALREHQKMMEETADSHTMAIMEMQKIREEEGEEAAKEFIEMVNESFRARDIAEIEFNTKEGGRR